MVQTVDFFTPVVDDPWTFGQIAAANSLSDIYAMAAEPKTAMNILCYPIRDRDPEELTAIIRGGAEKAAEARVVILGGHSVEDAEPKFGMAVTGIVNPDSITTNASARPGDMVVLTKALGTGIITTAAKYQDCEADILEAACRSMQKLNASAAAAMRAVGAGRGRAVQAATDITGYSLAGHLYRMAAASGVVIRIDPSHVPVLPGAEALAVAGHTTRGGAENLEYVRAGLGIECEIAPSLLHVLADPQTSGGLAICVAEESLQNLLDALTSGGAGADVIGRVEAGTEPRLRFAAIPEQPAAARP